MRKQTFLALLISVLLVNGFFSTNIIKSNHKFYANQIDDLISKNDDLNSQLNEFYKYGIEVDVTMYQPVVRQTDNTPNVTADGTRIRISRASDYKFVALSRNLLSRWGGPFNYGDFILIKVHIILICKKISLPPCLSLLPCHRQNRDNATLF